MAGLAIRKLSARTPASAEPVAARLALQALAADLEDALPPGLPPQALLWLRRLQLQAPEAALRRLPAAAGRRDWIARGREQLEAAWMQAARPALGPVPETAPAVLFADAAEMLACLALAAQAGQLDRWWWRGLLGRAWPRWQQAWAARPQAQAAAVRLLMRSGQVKPAGQVLPVSPWMLPQHASREAGAPSLSAVAPTAAVPEPATGAGPRADLAVGTVRQAQAPAAPSAPAADNALRAPPSSGKPRAGTAAQRRVDVATPRTSTALRTDGPAPSGAGAAAPGRRPAAAVDSGPWRPPESPAVAAPAPPDPGSPTPRQVAGEAGEAPVAVLPAAAAEPSVAATARLQSPAALPSTRPMAVPGAVNEPASGRLVEPGLGVAAPAPPSPSPGPGLLVADAAMAWPWPQALASRQAPLLFIVNALLEDGLYPDFTRPADPGLPVPLWALLAALARAWRLPADDPLPGVLAAACAGWTAPGVMPAAPGVPAGLWPAWLAGYARTLRRRLCRRLGLRASAWRAALVLPRPARLWLSEAEWVAEFDLAAHDLAWRLAGLDRDPGWLPSAGLTLRFRFVG
ncbi:hypothetical protein LXT12_05620 [Pelomonas sp. P7]|uniref:Uncharacterized protein n=1 Tax=Pelomonas caseinilytica TaxID=2906763 RepID=A0ABS8XDT9_9BURK|nr:hypothetical protein [Pelomonas sp. P7]MCE4536728.1 hypothetical protein [Pelomonas sp. P7]